jgi:hypothetical protein
MATNEAGKNKQPINAVLAKNEMHVTLTENKHEWDQGALRCWLYNICNKDPFLLILQIRVFSPLQQQQISTVYYEKLHFAYF